MEFIEKKFEDKLSQIPKEPGCQMAESQSTAGEILLPLLDRKLPRVLIASSYQTCNVFKERLFLCRVKDQKKAKKCINSDVFLLKPAVLGQLIAF